MDMKEKIAVIEEILDVDEGTLEETTVLNDLDEWDSITKLSLMIFFDEEKGIKLTSDDIKEFNTVKDIADLLK